MGSRDQHAGFETFRGDSDRLGDRDCAEATRIEDVNLSQGRGFGDGARESLAWRSATAWIRIVTDARNPGAGCLCLHGRTRERERDQSKDAY